MGTMGLFVVTLKNDQDSVVYVLQVVVVSSLNGTGQDQCLARIIEAILDCLTDRAAEYLPDIAVESVKGRIEFPHRCSYHPVAETARW